MTCRSRTARCRRTRWARTRWSARSRTSPPGETCAGTFEMAAGEYLLLCNIVEAEPDGAVESHYEEGMVTEFEVG